MGLQNGPHIVGAEPAGDDHPPGMFSLMEWDLIGPDPRDDSGCVRAGHPATGNLTHCTLSVQALEYSASGRSGTLNLGLNIEMRRASDGGPQRFWDEGLAYVGPRWMQLLKKTRAPALRLNARGRAAGPA